MSPHEGPTDTTEEENTNPHADRESPAKEDTGAMRTDLRRLDNHFSRNGIQLAMHTPHADVVDSGVIRQ